MRPLRRPSEPLFRLLLAGLCAACCALHSSPFYLEYTCSPHLFISTNRSLKAGQVPPPFIPPPRSGQPTPSPKPHLFCDTFARARARLRCVRDMIVATEAVSTTIDVGQPFHQSARIHGLHDRRASLPRAGRHWHAIATWTVPSVDEYTERRKDNRSRMEGRAPFPLTGSRTHISMRTD